MLNNYHSAERTAALRDSSAGRPAPRDDLDAIAIMLAGFNRKEQVAGWGRAAIKPVEFGAPEITSRRYGYF